MPAKRSRGHEVNKSAVFCWVNSGPWFYTLTLPETKHPPSRKNVAEWLNSNEELKMVT